MARQCTTIIALKHRHWPCLFGSGTMILFSNRPHHGNIELPWKICCRQHKHQVVGLGKLTATVRG